MSPDPAENEAQPAMDQDRRLFQERVHLYLDPPSPVQAPPVAPAAATPVEPPQTDLLVGAEDRSNDSPSDGAPPPEKESAG